MIEKFDYNGYEIATFVYDGDRERLKELWIDVNGEFIGAIRFRSMKPSQQEIEQYVDEYFSEMALGIEP